MTPIEREIMNLRKEVDALRDKTRNIPSRWVGSSITVFEDLNNSRGNDTLETVGATTITGAKYNGSSSVTSVPFADPNDALSSLGSLPEGLCVAQIISTGENVYVATRPDPGTGVVVNLTSSIPDGSYFISKASVSLDSDDFPGTFVSVRLAYRF